MNAKVTSAALMEMKKAGEKITSLTAYDASFATILDDAGIDIVLVGDSLGMVLQGKETTLAVSMDDMVYHTKIVAPRCQRAMVVADLPFQSYESPAMAMSNAARLRDEAGAEVVKLEGGVEMAETVRQLCDEGFEVCGHVGMQPQSIEKYGGFKVQGRDEESANYIIDGAKALQEAGAAMIVLECIPSVLAENISKTLTIPTIGIGAGVDCDGQVLVIYDALDISGRTPRMAKNFLAEGGNIRDAVARFIAAVKSREFPAPAHSFS